MSAISAVVLFAQLIIIFAALGAAAWVVAFILGVMINLENEGEEE